MVIAWLAVKVIEVRRQHDTEGMAWVSRCVWLAIEYTAWPAHMQRICPCTCTMDIDDITAILIPRIRLADIFNFMEDHSRYLTEEQAKRFGKLVEASWQVAVVTSPSQYICVPCIDSDKDDFLHAYARLAEMASIGNQRLWPFKPKHHAALITLLIWVGFVPTYPYPSQQALAEIAFMAELTRSSAAS